MAFNSSANKVATKRLVKVIETKVTGRVSITDERVIQRALDGIGSAMITNDEKLGENVLISGVVNLDAYFLGDNGLNSEQITIDFSERMTLGEVEACSFVSRVKSSKVTKESEKVLVANVVVETKVYGVLQDEVELLAGEEDGFYTEMKEVSINRLIASANTNFSTTTTLDDVGSGKILSVQSTTAVNKLTPFDNYISLEGSVTLDYLVATEEQVKRLQKTVDFTEEVPVLNIASDAVVDYVVYDRCVLVNFGEAGEQIADISIGLGVWGFMPTSVNLITDAFSDKSNVNLTYSSLEATNGRETKPFSERKTLVFLQENKKRMDEIVFVGAVSSDIQEVKYADGMVEVVGYTRAQVVYKNYDSDETLNGEVGETFNLSIPVEVKDGDVFAEISLNSRVANYKNKPGKDITLSVDYDGIVTTSSTTTEQFVSKLEVLEVLNANRSSIVVYKTKMGESAFEIAKKLNISPNILLAQNPQIADTGIPSQVVVYRKIN